LWHNGLKESPCRRDAGLNCHEKDTKMPRKHTRNTISALLEQPTVRKVGYEDQAYYSVEDLIAALTESAHPAEYWADLKRRETALASQCERLELPSADGRLEVADVINLEGVLRLLQSVPSPKAERVRQWLAESGRQRLQEMENPELAVIRMRQLYERQGHSRQWIDKRLRGMSARQELTSEWARRGTSDSEQYRALTNTIMNSAFGMDVETYRRHKNLTKPNQNLRDHMTDLELVLTMLGETVAASLHRDHNSGNFEQLQSDVADAGEITARTRREIERRGGRQVVSGQVAADRRQSGDLNAVKTDPEPRVIVTTSGSKGEAGLTV
jgi:DNA-damage-inducible protein D